MEVVEVVVEVVVPGSDHEPVAAAAAALPLPDVHWPLFPHVPVVAAPPAVPPPVALGSPPPGDAPPARAMMG
jgi:hypothetical protein